MLKNLYLFVGRSGAGKTTITEELQKRYGYRPLSSYTDRAPRYEGEDSHIFLTPTEFNAIDPDTILAYTQFNGHRYCATQELVDNCDLYVIDPPGIDYLFQRYKWDRPIVIIGITVPQETLRARMRQRGDTPEQAEERLQNDDAVFAGMEDICDVLIENLELDQTVDAAQEVIMRYEHKTNDSKEVPV